MKCHDLDEQLALYAGGDLNAGERESVEAHLQACERCTLFLAGLHAMREALKTAAEPDAGLCDEVRARVQDAIAVESRHSALGVAGSMALLAASIMLISGVAFFSRTPEARPPEMRQTAVQPAAPAEVDGPLSEVASLPARSEPSHTMNASNTPKTAPPSVIRMETSNPDIVIVWVVSNEETENDYTKAT